MLKFIVKHSIVISNAAIILLLPIAYSNAVASFVLLILIIAYILIVVIKSISDGTKLSTYHWFGLIGTLMLWVPVLSLGLLPQLANDDLAFACAALSALLGVALLFAWGVMLGREPR